MFFFRESVDAIANSTLMPSVENYHALIDNNPHSRMFDDRIAEHVVRNSSTNGTVINLLRALKEALLRMVEGPFPFQDLKDKLLDAAAFEAWTSGRVLKFKEKPTKFTFTCMVLNEANEAYDKMLILHSIVKVPLVDDPDRTFVPSIVEEFSYPGILKNFCFINFNEKEKEAGSYDDNFHIMHCCQLRICISVVSAVLTKIYTFFTSIKSSR